MATAVTSLRPEAEEHELLCSVSTFQPFNAIQLCQQLVDNPVCDACGVMASLWGNGVELLKEQHARGSC